MSTFPFSQMSKTKCGFVLSKREKMGCHPSLILLVLWLMGWATVLAQPVYRHTASLPATDGLGRQLPMPDEVGPERKDRAVGLFYWTWHTAFAKQMEAFDLTKFLREHPEALADYHHPAWGGRLATHFWGEPLFGYYRDTDAWVLRKHAELLGEAGVDVLIFDCTNGGELWTESFMKLCEVFMEARHDGVCVPQIAFLMAFAPTPESREAIGRLYRDFYGKGLYRDLWFYWKGKPLLMAYRENLPKEIQDFFTFRPGQPAYQGGPQTNEQWGWLEVSPQNGYVSLGNGRYEEMPVGVAQNWSAERGLTAMNAPNTFGRSYTYAYGQSADTAATAWGLNFQEQWERALAVDPEFIFVTGWNEWLVGRFEKWQQQNNAFPDEFSMEKSRDIEPMKGGFGDSYYYQLVANIRRYKGIPVGSDNSVEQTRRKVDWDYWANIDNGFKTHRNNTQHRDSPGWGSYHFENHTGRNDLTEAKVAHDSKNLYFYIECDSDITLPADGGWMRLFIDVDCNRATGWEGYDYMVSRVPNTTHAYLEHCQGTAWMWTDTVSVDYRQQGNRLFFIIPKRLFGIGRRQNFHLQFKWSDNMQKEGDILDFLINGDVAPMGRFNYEFIGN